MAHTEEKLVNLLAAPIKNEGYELVDLEYNRHGVSAHYSAIY